MKIYLLNLFAKLSESSVANEQGMSGIDLDLSNYGRIRKRDQMFCKWKTVIIREQDRMFCGLYRKYISHI